jgi:hypothetical protein
MRRNLQIGTTYWLEHRDLSAAIVMVGFNIIDDLFFFERLPLDLGVTRYRGGLAIQLKV